MSGLSGMSRVLGRCYGVSWHVCRKTRERRVAQDAKAVACHTHEKLHISWMRSIHARKAHSHGAAPATRPEQLVLECAWYKHATLTCVARGRGTAKGIHARGATKSTRV